MSDHVDGLEEMFNQLRGVGAQWEPTNRPGPLPPPDDTSASVSDLQIGTHDTRASLQTHETGFYAALKLGDEIPFEKQPGYRKEIEHFDKVIGLLKDSGQVVPDEALGWRMANVPAYIQGVIGRAATLVEGEWVPGKTQDKSLHEVAIAPFSIAAAVRRIERKKTFGGSV